VNIEEARKHHKRHGDMDGRICLLNECPIHYPKESLPSISLKNCTGKNVLRVKRVGGDLEIRVMDLSDRTLFQEWYQIKKPHKKNYSIIENLFKQIENKIVMEE